MKRKISAIDLYCGIGGLTKGLIKAGIKVKLGVDIDPSCKYAYTSNNRSKFLCQSVTDIKGNQLQNHFDSNSDKLLAGCAPCQTFSTYYQKAKLTDNRWWLLRHFGRLVQEVKPDYVTMENVPGLTRKSVFNDFLKVLSAEEYFVWYDIVDCSKYGIPQKRHRLVLLAAKKGPISLINPKRYLNKPKTVRETISHLPEINSGEGYEGDPVHISCKLSDLNMKRIMESRPGGTWRDWPEELRADCHKKESGKTYGGVYGRMEWDKPSPTLTTQFFGFGNGRFGHPEQNRAISIREGAIIQSFPENYRFFKPGSVPIIKELGRLIGNAVPVKLGYVIGKSILKHQHKYHRDELFI